MSDQPKNIAGEFVSMRDLYSRVEELRISCGILGNADHLDTRFASALELIQKYARKLDAINVQLSEVRILAMSMSDAHAVPDPKSDTKPEVKPEPDVTVEACQCTRCGSQQKLHVNRTAKYVYAPCYECHNPVFNSADKASERHFVIGRNLDSTQC